MPHAFISYVREDSAVVARLASELSALGVDVWVDRRQLTPGQRWKAAIRRAIQTGSAFVACFSEHYSRRDRTFMNEELTLAIEELRKFPQGRSWFIPICLTDCAVPDLDIGAGQTLTDLQWVSLHDDWVTGVEKIASVLNPIPPHISLCLSVLESGTKEFRELALDTLKAQAHPVAINAIAKLLPDEQLGWRAMGALMAQGSSGAQKLLAYARTASTEAVAQVAWHLLLAFSAKENEGLYNSTLAFLALESDRNVKRLLLEIIYRAQNREPAMFTEKGYRDMKQRIDMLPESRVSPRASEA